MEDSFAGIEVPEGEPDALESAGTDFRGMATATSGIATQLQGAPAELSGWLGPASAAFTAVSLATSASASASTEAFAHAAREADNYAQDLREARSDSREAIEDAREAQRRIDQAERELESAQAANAEAALRHAGAAARLLIPDMTGASASAAHTDMQAAQRDIDAAADREGRARLALEDARDELERAQRRGERAQQRAADAREQASLAFGTIGFGLPGTPTPGGPAIATTAGATAPALTPFARLASAQSGSRSGDGQTPLGASAFGPLAAAFAWLNPAPSNDYRSWQAPARREAEREQLYDDAQPATEEFDIEDLDGLDEGKLRVGLFIQAEEAGPFAIPLLVNPKLEGNSRGFNSQFSPNQTKGYIELDFARDKAFVQVNPTCDADGSDCEDAKDIAQDDLLNFGDYKNEVEPNDTDGDEVHVSWELSQAKGTKYLPWEAAELVSGPSIDGDLHVSPGPDGRPIVELDGDDFPSREVYYDDAEGRTFQAIPPREEDGGWGPLGDGSYKLLPIID